MRLCIADPPYLGRAVRWYGPGGCGDGGGEGQADQHPYAYLWDQPSTHHDLVRDLDDRFDGWAIAMSAHSLSTYLQVVDTDSRNGVRVAVWHKPNAGPSGSRIHGCWEPVLVRVPEGRRGRADGLPATRDVLTANSAKQGFTGSKPPSWTRWVLDMMGYDAEADTVTDLFHGSGAVAAEAAQGVIL